MLAIPFISAVNRKRKKRREAECFGSSTDDDSEHRDPWAHRPCFPAVHPAPLGGVPLSACDGPWAGAGACAPPPPIPPGGLGSGGGLGGAAGATAPVRGRSRSRSAGPSAVPGAACGLAGQSPGPGRTGAAARARRETRPAGGGGKKKKP
uniref:Uncharacterized protein n=1 Tax=Apteryx owenii TaxID=8824 RepID=A0A8B9NW10_APTOW